MEEFKKFEDITQPDERNLFFVVYNNDTGEQRTLSLEDIYRSVDTVILKDSVPEDIRSQFNVAKNIAIYSWYSYSFHQVADLKAYATVEAALRLSLQKQKESLKELLKIALKRGMLKDSGFSHLTDDSKKQDEWVNKIPDFMPDLRNSLAHGGTTLHPWSILNLKICADLINQLF